MGMYFNQRPSFRESGFKIREDGVGDILDRLPAPESGRSATLKRFAVGGRFVARKDHNLGAKDGDRMGRKVERGSRG